MGSVASPHIRQPSIVWEKDSFEIEAELGVPAFHNLALTPIVDGVQLHLDVQRVAVLSAEKVLAELNTVCQKLVLESADEWPPALLEATRQRSRAPTSGTPC